METTVTKHPLKNDAVDDRIWMCSLYGSTEDQMEKIFTSADILLPKVEDMKKWSVIACDQYTSEPQYWENAKEFTEGAPTTLELILPEVYLDRAEECIPQINAKMREYLGDVLFERRDAMIYLRRTIPDGRVREGIVGKVDLEAYDYRKGSDAAIRATEETVISRIPPRVAIRKDAEIELPHIMMLYDDEENAIADHLSAKLSDFERAYDFELIGGAGRIEGWFIDAESALYVSDQIESARGGGMALCVGDGNHSLASAKALYEQIKADIGESAARSHPARYALCEIVNIHSPALDFEPIHRLITDCDTSGLLGYFAENFDENKPCHTLAYTSGGKRGEIKINKNEAGISVDPLQKLLDSYLKEVPAEIDYIHGDDSLLALSARENAIGIYCEPISKDGLFSAVRSGGSLPRKTFSMGIAKEKRHYLEARRIK